MARQIVYLDHSVLSRAARDASSPLACELTALVEADLALFPYSWAHHFESELDTRLEEAILQIGARLSQGVRFHPWAQIVAAQARRGYLAFVGEDQTQVNWRDAYLHDPRADISPRWMDSMLHARVASGQASRDLRRDVKRYFANSLESDRSLREKESFQTAKVRYEKEGVEFFFVMPKRNALSGNLTDLVIPMLEFGARVGELAIERAQRAGSRERAIQALASEFDFYRSPFCRSLPFIDLHSSILASLGTDERDRPYKPGDFYDLETWSAYLPYVDIAVADRQMHQVLRRRDLAAKYSCRVLPGTQAGLDELVAVLRTA